MKTPTTTNTYMNRETLIKLVGVDRLKEMVNKNFDHDDLVSRYLSNMSMAQLRELIKDSAQ